MKIVLIGGVTSTLLTLFKLHQHGYDDVHVFGYEPEETTEVSGWRNLQPAAHSRRFAYRGFRRVVEHASEIRVLEPDVIFAVGLSQLIPPSIIACARLGVVGFHPTALPKGRGRAPIAWLVLRCEDGAASFFRLQAGTDDGPILVQQPFTVEAEDTAATVETKILEAAGHALDRWLPRLRTEGLLGEEQDHELATYYGRRTREDGLIDWRSPSAQVMRLIKATTRPHPGAYTYQEDQRITIWAVEAQLPETHFGATGRVLQVDASSFLVQCGDQAIRVTEWSASPDWQPRVGTRLGYQVEDEVHRLRSLLSSLQQHLSALEMQIADKL
jgi:methionyl-tRNA formyltransferase